MTDSFKKINFIGSHKEELILYLASLINMLDLRCLVIDGTLRQQMQYMVPVNSEGGLLTFRGVDYIDGIINEDKFRQLHLGVYDVVIVDYGFNQDLMSTIDENEQIFLVTDFQRYHIEPLKEILSCIKEGREIIKIYKDIVRSKISPKYIDHQLNLDGCENVVAEYLFELDEVGYGKRLNSQYDESVNLRYMNHEHQVFYSDLLEELFNIKVKSIKKLLRNGMRRKKDASSFLEFSSWTVSNYN